MLFQPIYNRAVQRQCTAHARGCYRQTPNLYPRPHTGRHSQFAVLLYPAERRALRQAYKGQGTQQHIQYQRLDVAHSPQPRDINHYICHSVE